MTALDQRPLITFLGDDFTGSSAVMELLSFSGLPAVLFLNTPRREQIARFAHYAGIGIATVARSKSPSWMEQHLPPAYDLLAALKAPISHYKVCSTFDSAPHVGSIGEACDLAMPKLGGTWTPLIVGAPAIGRYQVFGNLFAAVGGEGFRLDRHPTMAHHPVTPMHEADVRRHLAAQTDKTIGLIDFLTLGRGDAVIDSDSEIIAIDIIDEASLVKAGRLIWENRGARLFCVGSQGIEYALLAYWRAAGLVERQPARKKAGSKPVAAVSGSCSPVTAAQIAWAESNGYCCIQIEAGKAADVNAWQQELERVVGLAAAAMSGGRSALVYTAQGPDGPAVDAVRRVVSATAADADAINDRIGEGLGQILRRLVERAGVQRLCIAGGDTSGRALSSLRINALEARVELAPACAINFAHSKVPSLDGIEIAIKGGQMGPENYFGLVATGG